MRDLAPEREETARLEGVGKRYRRQAALEDVSFALREGEVVALVGHNGAGKTTLMKLMLGLIRPTSGRLAVLGADPGLRDAQARSRTGYLPENVAFNPSLSARELLTFYASLKGLPRAGVEELLAQVGLTEAARRRVGTYSKGMRQRLGLAQALLGSPKLLLLDEPTTGLDPALRASFYELLLRLKEDGATVVLSSHALTELEERADRVIIMNRGRMIADGAIEDLRRIADLPVRMKLETGPDWTAGHAATLAEAAEIAPAGTGVALTCRADRKMDVLRAVVGLGPAVRDLQILPPTLDELYAHFLRGEGVA